MHDGSDDPVSELDDGVMIALQVVPRASKSRVLGRHGDRVKIQLAAPPVDGAANAALIDLLAEVLACPRGAVEIVAGETGKRKRVRVRGVVAQVVRRSMGLLPAAALAVIAATLPACAPFTSDLEVDVVLPEDHDDLEAADNASLLLGPDGTVETIAADGVDFSFRVELEPDDVVHLPERVQARQRLRALRLALLAGDAADLAGGQAQGSQRIGVGARQADRRRGQADHGRTAEDRNSD